MNFQLFNQRMEKWREKTYLSFRKLSWSSTNLQQQSRKNNNSRSWNKLEKAKPPLMLALTVISLTSVFGNSFYQQPELKEGTISPRTYISPYYYSFVDDEMTEKKRQEAINGNKPVLKQDTVITEQIISGINAYLTQIQTLRESIGKIPYIKEVDLLSLESQLYLRECSEEEWQEILEKIKNPTQVHISDLGLWGQNNLDQAVNISKNQAIAELKKYRNKVSESDFKLSIDKIINSRKKYKKAWEKFSQKEQNTLSNEHKKIVLEVSDKTWEKTDRIIRKAARRIVTQGIPEGMPPNLIAETINVNLGANESLNEQNNNSESIPEETNSLATEILVRFLKPNLTKDQTETEKQAQRAAKNVQPVIIYLKKEQVIVEKDEELTREQALQLDAIGKSQRGIDWQGLLLTGVFVTGTVIIIEISKNRSKKKTRFSFRCRDQLLLCLLSLSSSIIVILPAPYANYTNLPAVGLLTSSFYGANVAVTQVSTLTGLIMLNNQPSEGKDNNAILAGAVGGIVGALVAGRLRDRDKLAQLGLSIGLIQWLAYLIFKLIISTSPSSVFLTALHIQQGMFYGLFSGIGWSIVAIGIAPYLERLFDLVTPIRLAELSNTNKPLLKRLAEEAPGTWQHTLFVASLAEAAARKLNCNVELVRAGTLYHDIGKLHDPQGFIENQKGGVNKHDKINNPWKSAEIIKKHVSEGIRMARREGLPQAITDFIPQHQGTFLISYFYIKAKEKAEEKGENSVSEADFRYDGPIPQSREAGIMMLADGCEAALRSLKDATTEKALGMVNKMLEARWHDNQLVDSGLEHRELKIIAKVFVEVWEQSRHKRVPYPKGAIQSRKT